jgi:hypothetical protein
MSKLQKLGKGLMVGAVQGVKGGAQDVELVGTQMGSRSKRLQILEVETFKTSMGGFVNSILEAQWGWV